jgi:acyl carrier protein
MSIPDPTTERLVLLARRIFGARAERLGADDDLFEVLGIDSMQALELLTEVESEFGIEIPDYELQGVTTLRGIAAVVARRLS